MFHLLVISKTFWRKFSKCLNLFHTPVRNKFLITLSLFFFFSTTKQFILPSYLSYNIIEQKTREGYYREKQGWNLSCRKHYPQFTLCTFYFADSGVELKRGRACFLDGMLSCIVYRFYLCFLDSGVLTPVPGRGSQEPSYPLQWVVHNAFPERLLHRSTTTRAEWNQWTRSNILS